MSKPRSIDRVVERERQEARVSEDDRGVFRRRIGERERLVSEIEAWQHQRNTAGARVNWKFTTQKARHKLARAYPDIANQP